MDYLQPADLVGCRYRRVMRRTAPAMPPTQSARRRRARARAAVREAMDRVPTGPALGDSKVFTRIDIPRPKQLSGGSFPVNGDEERWFATLEALAAGATIITGAVFVGRTEGKDWMVNPDVLVRRPDGTYMPVVISMHRVARVDERSTQQLIAVDRLGLGPIVEGAFRLRHHPVDGYRLAMSAWGLKELGLDSGLGAAIGQDITRAFVVDTGHYSDAAARALTLSSADFPLRTKECASCRFWPLCEEKLVKADDLSLFLPGQRGEPFRDKGITTVKQLIDSGGGSTARLAVAWREGIPVLKKPGAVVQGSLTTAVIRRDVEIDVDMEAYLDHGAYLWGTWDGTEYKPFQSWEFPGGAAEAANFAAFWQWLMARREDAHAEGKTFGAFCYAASAENYRLKISAERFAGMHPGVPTSREVQAFINSGDWIDVLVPVQAQLVGPRGLGLKITAKAAGFSWPDEGDGTLSVADGEASVHAFRVAAGVTGDDAQKVATARKLLLDYNRGDCEATARVRQWLDDGAPGIREL